MMQVLDWCFLQDRLPTPHDSSAPVLWHGAGTSTRVGTPSRNQINVLFGKAMLEHLSWRSTALGCLFHSSPKYLCTAPEANKPHQFRQAKLPMEEILSPMWQHGQGGWESTNSPSPLPPGNCKSCLCCAVGTTHTSLSVRRLCTVTSAAQSPIPQMCQ